MVLTMDRWIGKIAVVTGASAGIGAAISQQLVQEGLNIIKLIAQNYLERLSLLHKSSSQSTFAIFLLNGKIIKQFLVSGDATVIGLARRVERIENLSRKLSNSKGSLHGLEVDMSNTKEITSAFKIIEEKFGPIHILINNAGIVHNTTLVNGDIEKWRQVIDVNVMGLCVATREAVNNMTKNGVSGHIVHINSDLGHVIPSIPGLNVYPASKFAVTALTEVLRGELMRSDTKIKVTSVCPGLVGQTEIFDAAGGVDSGIDKAPSLYPEDIADAVIYALSTPPHVQVHEVIVKPLGADH